MKMTGVGGVFCAAHEDKRTGNLHGHTWRVIAWFEMVDRLEQRVEPVDHRKLSPELAWGEDMAEWIAKQMNSESGAPRCQHVQVNRPDEHIYASWHEDPSAPSKRF